MIETILFVFFILAAVYQTLVFGLIINPLWRKNKHKKSNEPPVQLPGLSIIICARNEANHLKTLLPAVLEQSYPGDWEVLVVNDASTDDTAHILSQLQAKYPVLQVITIQEKRFPGKKKALETGIMASKHPLILLTDADCRPASNIWAQKMCSLLTEDGTELVLGWAPSTPEKGCWNTWLQFETGFIGLQYFSMALAGMPYMGVGRNLAFKKNLFIQHGAQLPYPELASGDDDLFVNQVANTHNTTICLDPDTRVFSSGKPHFKLWLKQKNRHISASIFYHWSHQIILGAFHLSMVVHYGLAAILLCLNAWPFWVVTGYSIRIIPTVIAYRRVFQALQIPIRWYVFPFQDGLMALFEGIYLPYALWWKKRIHWK